MTQPSEKTETGPDVPLRDAAARGVLWTVTEAWGARLMSIVVFAILGRELDASAFGLMAMGVAVVEFARLLVAQGFSRNIVQRVDLDDGHLDTAFWTALVTGALLAGAAALASPLVAAGFDEPELTPVLRVLSLSLLLTSLTTTQTAILRRGFKFQSLAMRQLASVAIGGAVGVAAALTGAGVWALVAQNLTQGVVAVLVLWTVSPWRPGRRFSKDRFREMLSFGTTTLGIELVGYFARRGDDILIGVFLGTTALGFFNVAFRILTIVTEIFTSTVNAVAFPVFSRLQGDPDRIRRALHLATRTSSALAFPAFLGLTVLAPEFVTVIFGDGWGPSIEVLRILAIMGMLQSVGYFNRSVLLGLGKPTWELLKTIGFVVTKLAAVAIGFRWGLTGVAWSIVIHSYLFAPIGIWLINRATPIQPKAYLRQFVAPLAASGLMAASVFPVQRWLLDDLHAVAVLAIGAALGAVVYFVSLRLLSPSLVRELVGEARRVLPIGRFRHA